MANFLIDIPLRIKARKQKPRPCRDFFVRYQTVGACFADFYLTPTPNNTGSFELVCVYTPVPVTIATPETVVPETDEIA